MNALVAWLRSKNWSTHAIVVSLGSFAVFITSDPQAQQFLVSMLKAHPAIATQIIVLAGIITTYKRSSSPAGTVAQGIIVAAGTNPPTAAQVNATTTQDLSAITVHVDATPPGK
jgi:hypothetical protein